MKAALLGLLAPLADDLADCEWVAGRADSGGQGGPGPPFFAPAKTSAFFDKRTIKVCVSYS